MRDWYSAWKICLSPDEKAARRPQRPAAGPVLISASLSAVDCHRAGSIIISETP
jgi:hypothetical protein